MLSSSANIATVLILILEVNISKRGKTFPQNKYSEMFFWLELN